MASTLYILYNADASVMGKLNYGYRKLTAPKDQPACAACDITHGGMHFDETAAWKEAKAKMAQGSHAQMHQLHRDEMGADMKQFVEAQKLRYPMVLSGSGEGDFKLVMDNSELAACNGSAGEFVQRLSQKGALDTSSAGSSSSL